MPVLRIQRFKCILGTWTYNVLYDHAVIGYYKSLSKAQERARQERKKLKRKARAEAASSTD